VAAGRFQVLNAFVDRAMAGLTRAEVAVWLVLYRDSREGVARTSLADMARRGGMEKRTVLRAVRRLEGRGLLEVVRRGGLSRGPSSYRVRAVPGDG
jgi:DNA-binding MarR family transcriptional regulator